MKRSAILPAVPAALLLLLVGASATADTIERGYVVHIEDREIYFDIGTGKGITTGQRVRIKRPIRLQHPVTGRAVSDWLPIGATNVTAAGDTLSMVRLDPALLARVAVGDVVEALILSPEPAADANAPAAAPPPPPAVEEALPAIDAETEAVLAVWQAAAGKPVELQIGAWEDYLAAHPDSPYATAVHEDLEILRAHRDRLHPPELALEEQELGGLQHAAPTRAPAGEPIELAFLIEAPEQLAAAWLHYRQHGARSYSKAVMHRAGADYLRGTIPAGAVQAPGIEYFVEIATRRGNVGTAVGRPAQPVAVAVEEPTLAHVFAERHNRSRVSISTTYLDFATFDDRSGDHTDAFFLLEADFLYRLRGPVYGIRSGFGILNGRGGFTDRVYTDRSAAPKVGFNYGYTELELRGPRQTAVLARVVAGAGRDGFGMGVEGRFRLGAEDGTNLTVGASRVAELGFLTDIRMQWNAVEHYPLGLAVAVTDQPNRGELGVRLTTDIGYRALPWFQPTLRLSYQARTVVHSGLGAGLGLVFDW